MQQFRIKAVCLLERSGKFKPIDERFHRTESIGSEFSFLNIIIVYTDKVVAEIYQMEYGHL